jgi:hypothetical protein
VTEEERLLLEWHLWLDAWIFATPVRRTELLQMKARIEAATGWAWTPPYSLDNPPRLTLPPA